MTVDAVYPEDLQAFTRQLGEENFALVDVRQPQEYVAGHIPGARLLPLPELESRITELKDSPNVIFYCRSGVRSRVAANLAEERLGPEIRVVNMVGGFTAWEDKDLRGLPRLRVFEAPKTLAEALARAMDLEKGTQLFYLSAAETAQSGAPGLARTLRTLAAVEESHARVLHHRLQQEREKSGDSRKEGFEKIYAALPGDILEGGLPLEEALARAAGAGTAFCLEVTDLALEIELSAYDLYRNLAASGDPGLKGIFLKLAEDELGHQRLLVRQLPSCPA